MEKISIIIGIYNGEKYIKRCIDSILNQTITNFEVIAVNDGSTDNSLKILKEYALLDKRIIIIDKKNEGVSVARNIGINKSSGKYILFVDIDDYLEKNALEIMLNIIKRENVDIVRCKYKIIGKNCYEKKLQYNGLYKLNNSNKDNLIKDILKQEIGSYLWLLLIKKELIIKNNIYFEKELYVHQDLDYYINLILHTKSIYFSNYQTYNYFVNESGSKSYKNTERNINSNINLSILLKKKLNKKYYEYINELSTVNILPSLYFLYKNNKVLTKKLYYKLLSNNDFNNIINDLPRKKDKYLLINYSGIFIIKKKYSFKIFQIFYLNIYTIFEYLKKIKKNIFNEH